MKKRKNNFKISSFYLPTFFGDQLKEKDKTSTPQKKKPQEKNKKQKQTNKNTKTKQKQKLFTHLFVKSAVENEYPYALAKNKKSQIIAGLR